MNKKTKPVKEQKDHSQFISLSGEGGDGLDEHARTMVLYPYVRKNNPINVDNRLAEAISLANAISLDVVYSETIGMQKLRAATYIGVGKVRDLAGLIKQEEIDLVIVDCSLSPIQQRNLERELNVKVIDRTGLILEIFGERAQTREGVLQVALAHFEYQKSRLVRSWTHLERQRGGGGFMGGPGERQIESDRRALRERIASLKAQLNKVAKTRTLHRENRGKVPFPVVALVGYTNAGKSTLFNRLTEAKVSAKNRLFETLDPTMRSISLPSGQKIILSDTVGFISDLPHELVAAFRATLEEVLAADVIIHVRDMNSDECEEQKEDVFKVMESLGLDKDLISMIECQNKIDLLDAETKVILENTAKRREDIVAISANTGEGVDELLKTIALFISKGDELVEHSLKYDEGEALSWLYSHGDVQERKDGKKSINVKVRLNQKNKQKFIHLFRS